MFKVLAPVSQKLWCSNLTEGQAKSSHKFYYYLSQSSALAAKTSADLHFLSCDPANKEGSQSWGGIGGKGEMIAGTFLIDEENIATITLTS